MRTPSRETRALQEGIADDVIGWMKEKGDL